MSISSFITPSGFAPASLWPDTATSSQGAAASSPTASNTGTVGDTINISAEARHALRLAVTGIIQDQAPEKSSWETLYGLKSGETTLADGLKRVVTVDDQKMKVLEYKGDKLIGRQTGIISGDRLVMNVERYDDQGRVSFSMRTEINGLQDAESAETSAGMNRSIQWFDQGRLIREMRDDMESKARYEGPFDPESGTALEEKTLDGLISEVTKDAIQGTYHADIVEYADENISRTVSVNADIAAVNLTNRSPRLKNGMEANTTLETAKTNGLSVTMSTYSPEGELLGQASFTDEVEKGGSLKQTVSVAWYKEGEIVDKRQGVLTMEATEDTALPARPSILEFFDIAEEDYSQSRPLPASGLLAQNLAESASSPDAFLDETSGRMAVGGYDQAGTLSETRSLKHPYELTFTRETFKDGELATTSRDTEEARVNHMPKETRFRTVTGLTEDDIPGLLRSTEHEKTAHEDGLATSEGRVAMREFVKRDGRGVFGLYTGVQGRTEGETSQREISGTRPGSLEDIDAAANDASAAMSEETTLALTAARSLFANQAGQAAWEDREAPLRFRGSASLV